MFAGEDLLWSEAREFSRAEAWIDLINLAAWKDRTMVESGVTVVLKRGDLLASERFLCQRWAWSRGRVQRFVSLLAAQSRVVVNRNHAAIHLGAIVSICNYDRFQLFQTGARSTIPTSDGPPTSHRQDQPRATDEPPTGPKRRNEKEMRRNEEAVVGGTRSAGADESPALLTFRCIKGKKSHGDTWDLTSAQLAEWEATYSDMDILGEARKARTWADAKGLKTSDGMPAFLVSWFNRGQNGGRYLRRAAARLEDAARAAEDEAWNSLPDAIGEDADMLREIQRELKARLEHEDYLTWFRPLRFGGREGSVFILAAPNSRFLATLQESYGAVLASAGEAVGVQIEIQLPAPAVGGVP